MIFEPEKRHRNPERSGAVQGFPGGLLLMASERELEGSEEPLPESLLVLVVPEGKPLELVGSAHGERPAVLLDGLTLLLIIGPVHVEGREVGRDAMDGELLKDLRELRMVGGFSAAERDLQDLGVAAGPSDLLDHLHVGVLALLVGVHVAEFTTIPAMVGTF